MRHVNNKERKMNQFKKNKIVADLIEDISQNNAKIVTPRHKMIYILFIYTHAHTTTERL